MIMLRHHSHTHPHIIIMQSLPIRQCTRNHCKMCQGMEMLPCHHEREPCILMPGITHYIFVLSFFINELKVYIKVQ